MWQLCFELHDGRPTGRWQWIIDADDGSYVFPGFWLQPESFAVPPELLECSSESRITQ